MKTWTCAGTWMLAMLGGFPNVALSAPELVPINGQYLFIPKGFDDNDTIEIVVDGYLPSTCYKIADPVVTTDAGGSRVKVQPMAQLFEGPCLLVLVPYTTVATVGILATGDYHVTTPGVAEQAMIIARSNNAGPDDHLYAPIDDVTVTVEPENRKIYAEVSGRYTDTCMNWERSEVIDSSDTIQLLPIINMTEQTANGDPCQQMEFPFKTVRIEIPWRSPGRYLLHTRGMNGKASNVVFSVFGE